MHRQVISQTLDSIIHTSLLVHVAVTTSELIVAQQFLAGLNEDTLHCTPPVVLVGGAHAMHLPLATDGVAVLFSRHTQENISAHVFEAHRLIALPMDGIALYRPHIQVIALPILSEGAYLLQRTQKRKCVQW